MERSYLLPEEINLQKFDIAERHYLCISRGLGVQCNIKRDTKVMS